VIYLFQFPLFYSSQNGSNVRDHSILLTLILLAACTSNARALGIIQQLLLPTIRRVVYCRLSGRAGLLIPQLLPFFAGLAPILPPNSAKRLDPERVIVGGMGYSPTWDLRLVSNDSDSRDVVCPALVSILRSPIEIHTHDEIWAQTE